MDLFQCCNLQVASRWLRFHSNAAAYSMMLWSTIVMKGATQNAAPNAAPTSVTICPGENDFMAMVSPWASWMCDCGS